MTPGERPRRVPFTFALLLGLLAGGASCARTHLTATHGQAYQRAFAVQTVNPHASTDPKAIQGLDSQEAAIISRSYRRSLSPKDQPQVDRPQLLTYSAQTGLREANVPPPSVPNER
jgi:hypothetical protein